MVDTAKLKGKFVEKGYDTKEKQAKVLNITTKTLRNKMEKGIFNSDEIFKMITILEIKDPVSIFFAQDVTQ